MEGTDLLHEIDVLSRCESLSTVAESFLGTRVNLYDQSVAANGNTRASQRSDHVVMARSMGRIHNDGQMRDPVHCRDDG